MNDSSLSQSGAFTLLAESCLTIMVGCVIVPGLSEIAVQLQVGHLANWLVTLPALGVVLAGPIAGRMIDRFGAYTLLLFGLLTYGLLGVMGAWLPGTLLQIVDRLLLGCATAIVMAAGTSLIASFYHGDARLAMMARQGMAIELGGVLFLFIGGILASIGWRWPYVLYLFAWLMLLLVLLYVPRPPQPFSSESEAATENSDSKLRPVLFAAICSMMCFFTAVIILPQRFAAMNVSAAHIGYFLSFVSLVAVLAAAIMPDVAQRFGSYATLIMAFTCYLLAHLEFAAASSMVLFLPGGMLLGIGFGLSIPLVNHMTVEISQPHERGRQLARLSMAIFSGQFLAAFMAYVPGGAAAAFIAAAVLAIINIVAMGKVRRGVAL